MTSRQKEIEVARKLATDASVSAGPLDVLLDKLDQDIRALKYAEEHNYEYLKQIGLARVEAVRKAIKELEGHDKPE